MTTITRYRIKGDWLVDGIVDNLNRSRHLDFAVVDGRAYDYDTAGRPDVQFGQINLIPGGELKGWGAGIGFQPDDGELDRVGRHVFEK